MDITEAYQRLSPLCAKRRFEVLKWTARLSSTGELWVRRAVSLVVTAASTQLSKKTNRDSQIMQPYVQSIYCQDAPNLPLCPLSANATLYVLKRVLKGWMKQPSQHSLFILFALNLLILVYIRNNYMLIMIKICNRPVSAHIS